MLDSLPYRNEAAIVLRRLMRSLPRRRGVIGVDTCDKGLPAMMMALAATDAIPAVLVPDGVTLLPEVDDLSTTRLGWNMPPKLDAAHAPLRAELVSFWEQRRRHK